MNTMEMHFSSKHPANAAAQQDDADATARIYAHQSVAVGGADIQSPPTLQSRACRRLRSQISRERTNNQTADNLWALTPQLQPRFWHRV